MSVLVFEDRQVSDLYPITIGRPAFAVTCGSVRLVDLLVEFEQPVHVLVRPHLAALVESDFLQVTTAGGSSPGRSSASDSQPLLVVNARLVPSIAARDRLLAIQRAGRPGVVRTGEAIAAAVLPPGGVPDGTAASSDALTAHLDVLDLSPLEVKLPLFDFPHDVIRHHLTSLADHLTERIARGPYREIADDVFVAEGATLARHVIHDTSGGPIVLDRGASIGPFCYLEGPIYVGPNGRVIEHASVKGGVALGHTTKVGGEVEATIIEPYTNKQHHGFMGHSYLGSWINLGAGTCNSDLKNTYGTVNMDYGGRRVPTGMQFVGAILGDYAKTAINTGLFTGKTVGVCSMLYGSVTTNVPSFVNYARSFGQVTATPVDVIIASQARMFARRNVPQRPCDLQLIRDMFELTQAEREEGGVPIEPLSL